jgi:hypothetical protein
MRSGCVNSLDCAANCVGELHQAIQFSAVSAGCLGQEVLQVFAFGYQELIDPAKRGHIKGNSQRFFVFDVRG